MESVLFSTPITPATPGELRLLIRKLRHRANFQAEIKRRYAGNQESIVEILNSYNFHTDVFKGRMRDNGESYMNGHLVPVASLGSSYWLSLDPIIPNACLGHDTIEDIEWMNRVLMEIVFGQRVAMIVDALTKPEASKADKKTPQYCRDNIAKIESGGIEAVFIKCLCDRLHNMLTLWGEKDKKKWKIHETEEFFLPLAEKYNLPTKELELAIQEQKILLDKP